MTLKNWHGQQSRLDAIYLDVLKLDDYVLADYIDDSQMPVNLYVAYYDSQRKGESAHSPRSCIPGGPPEIALDTETETRYLSSPVYCWEFEE